jgi:hypothetical protein
MSQPLVPVTMRQKAEAADADEPTGEHVLHKAPQEIVDGERHSPQAVAVGVVFVAECDLAILKRFDP